MSAWSHSEPPVTRYRVFIHRTPRRLLGYDLPLLWDLVYEHFDAQRMPGLERRGVSSVALRDGAEVLSELLRAYRSGFDEVRGKVNGLGHPCLRVTDAPDRNE